MNNTGVEQKVQKWVVEHASNGDMCRRDSLKRILHQLNFLEEKLFYQYEPSLPPNPSYFTRLREWLDNLATDADQQLAFELASRLFFVGRNEITALYRTAYAGPIMRWLIQSQNLSVISHNLQQQLNDSIQSTWFCPITDSMKINEFLHVNDIRNEINHRPDWQSLCKFGPPEKIKAYINNNNIKRIVLLEDFIATGTQASKAIQFAANLYATNPLPTLVVPLILCPQAVDTFANMNLPNHVTIDPVLLLEEQHFVLDDESKNTSTSNQFKKLAEQTYLQVSSRMPPSDTVKPYGPLGFGKTGGLLILATNTPDNTLPLVHWRSSTWNPLFPRHSRV